MLEGEEDQMDKLFNDIKSFKNPKFRMENNLNKTNKL